MNKIALIVCVLFLISCGKSENELVQQSDHAPINNFDPKVIYGPDNRLDFYQITNPQLLALADSSVALVKSADILASTQLFAKLTGSTFGENYGLCSQEPFREQITAAFCSGSLVAKDIILTAGHCIQSSNDCLNTKFVFGYNQKSPGQNNYTVPIGEIYGCQKIIHTQAVNNGADFALIKLDRPVLNHSPLAVRQSGAIQIGESLLVIGHPAGLPQKIAGGATVRTISPSYFVANLDTYGGNSGSPVFNARTLEIEGVLVRGEDDFTNQGSCSISNHCPDGSCRGEDVTKISEVIKFLAATPLLNEEVYTSTPQLTIPDNNKNGIASTLNVPTSPQGRKVLIKLNILHSWKGDLVVKITSPDGKTVILHNRTGASEDDIRGTMGADINSYQPLAPLSVVASPGPWKLQVIDQAAQDTGKLLEWAVVFSKN